MKNTLVAAALALFGQLALAADYYVVVPVQGKTLASTVQVNLAASTLPGASVGSPYSYNFAQNLQVTGDSQFSGFGVKWSVVDGALPAGLVLNSDTGVLAGTPSAAGIASFTLSAVYRSRTGAQAYQVTTSVNLAVVLGAGMPPTAVVGAAYSYNLKALLSVTGDAAYNGSGVTWTSVSSSLPAGLYLTTDGYIGGTPTAAGTGTLTARATYKGADGEQTYQVVSLAVSVTLAQATMPEGVVGAAYSYDLKTLLSVTGDPSYAGTGITWTSVASTLPAGLRLNSSGFIYGTPTASGAGSVTARATYRGVNGEQVYAVVVGDISVTLNSGTLKNGTRNVGYSLDLKPLVTVTGDAAYSSSSVQWELVSGSLPANLALNASTGLITGTPSTLGTANFGIRATYKSLSSVQNYAIQIEDLANFTATQTGMKIGTSAPGTNTSDAYYGPNGYSYATTAVNWGAMGAFYHDATTLNTNTRPVKSVSVASTFSGQGSAAAPKMIVVDLGQDRTFTTARYYQTFSDGKTTHAALDVSTTGTLQTRTSTSWTQVHDFVALDNSSTSDGVAATFPAVTARYIRVRLYNNGAYGFPNYTELYGMKLFNN